jgi:hypothetical protein
VIALFRRLPSHQPRSPSLTFRSCLQSPAACPWSRWYPFFSPCCSWPQEPQDAGNHAVTSAASAVTGRVRRGEVCQFRPDFLLNAATAPAPPTHFCPPFRSTWEIRLMEMQYTPRKNAVYVMLF